MAGIDYSERIPNNVRLADDRVLQRALEKWQPAFLDWWQQLGPAGFQSQEAYLRTATSVDAKGWATFGHVKTPEYRWGIFLTDAEPNRTIPAGDRVGKPVWQEVPGEHRADLRKLIVTQGDTEPASVEQQRRLGRARPRSMTCATCSRSTSKRDVTCRAIPAARALRSQWPGRSQCWSATPATATARAS